MCAAILQGAARGLCAMKTIKIPRVYVSLGDTTDQGRGIFFCADGDGQNALLIGYAINAQQVAEILDAYNAARNKRRRV